MKRKIFAIAILPWICIACNRQNNSETLLKDAVNIPATAANNKKLLTNESVVVFDTVGSATAFTTPDGAVPVQKANDAVTIATDIDKKIIKNATVKLEVKNYDSYAQKIKNIVKKFGGYVAKEENFLTDGKMEALVSIKVPVMYFEDALNSLPGEDAKQLERNITTEDVTGQMIDTKARLEAKTQTRNKYMEFLKQGKNMDDVLRVQSQINDIQEDIEAAQSRLAYMGGQTRFSTINLTFFESRNGYTQNGKPSYGNELVKAFATGGKWFGDLLLGIITVWPLWALGIFIGLAIKRARRPAVIKKNV